MELKKVLITGATGSIGEAIVKEYAQNGYFVYVHYNSNKEKAQNILDAIEYGELITFDMKDKSSIKNVLEDLHVDVLINNAGIIKDNLFFFMEDDEWEDVINTNLTGLYYITKMISKNMMMDKKGRTMTTFCPGWPLVLFFNAHWAATMVLPRPVGRVTLSMAALGLLFLMISRRRLVLY